MKNKSSERETSKSPPCLSVTAVSSARRGNAPGREGKCAPHSNSLEGENVELRQALSAAKQARDRYVDLYWFAPIGYLILSATGLILETNRIGAAITGLDRAELAGRDFESLIAIADRQRWRHYLVQTLHHPGTHECELTLVRDDGAEFATHMDGARHERDGDFVLRLVVSDISARRLADARRSEDEDALHQENERLNASNRDLEQFAYVASHDLQEPLRMVVSYGKMLEKKYGGELDDDARAFIGFMVDGGARMQSMISDLLEFSRIGREDKGRDEFDSGQAVTDSLLGLSLSVDEAEARVIHADLPKIIYDRPQFVRLMQNLIGNAIKYRSADRAPRIAVSARHTGAEWLFSVEDNGIGIDPAHFEHVFAIFRRLHPAGETRGTGIGLAVCRKIVEHHGGRIWVESRPGSGSTFRFTVLASH